VTLVRWNVDEIAGLHLDDGIVEPESGRSLNEQDPLVLILVVPEIGWCCVAMRDDALDPNV
jgi:hypothetical protein